TWSLGGNVNVNLSAGEGAIPTTGITDVEVVIIGADDDAYATLSGTTLTLYIPEAQDGAAGATGSQGIQGEEGPGAPGGIAIPIVALIIAIIAAGIAVMGMRRKV
ncbi:MAG: hypothetical protein MUP21_05670, partial [Dehalococcoidia bacterium]|nr:hypothetical protein [Dehalococcoidia bacterium]